MKIRWCEIHKQVAVGENDHCGCEFTEGCAFDNTSARYKTEWKCRIVSKLLVDAGIEIQWCVAPGAFHEGGHFSGALDGADCVFETRLMTVSSV